MTVATPLVSATVAAASDETPSLRAVRLVLPQEVARAHQRPGQVVKVHVSGGDAYFAVSSAPSAGGEIELLLKRGGRIADGAIASAVPGGTIRVTPPFGKGFPVEEAHGQHVLLFAAGSGIAPIRAVIQHILAHRGVFDRATLFYGQRHGADFAYRREHMAWERGGVRVVLCPSREDDAWPGMRGRVQEVAASLGFGGSPPETCVAFLSGMASMVEDVRATLSRAGVAPERMHSNF